MRKAPINVNSYIDFPIVLEALRLNSSPSVLKNRSRCPGCSTQSLRVTRDPTGGYRFVCPKCDFNLDSLRFYMKVAQLTPLEALHDLSQLTSLPSGRFTLWANGVLPQEQQYEKLIGLHRRGREDLVLRPTPEWTAALQRLNMRCSQDMQHQIVPVAGTFSGIKISDLEDALGRRLRLPRPRSTHALMIPFCDVYNRPRSLSLFLESGLERRVRVNIMNEAEYHAPQTEDGLCFLDQLEMREERVFAVHGARLASFLRCLHLSQSTERLPLVGWEEHTNRAWDTVHASQVIIWSPLSPLLSFIMGQRVVNAWVCLRRAPSFDEAIEQIEPMTSGQWMAATLEQAKPWRLALIDWLLSVGAKEAMNGIEALRLPHDLAMAIIDLAPQDKRPYMLSLFGFSDREKIAIVRGRTIAETSSGWWEVPNSLYAFRGRILDASIYMEEVQRLPDGRRLVLGHVKRGNQAFPFECDLDQIQAKTCEWLQTFLSDLGQPAPIVDRRWKQDLFRIAQEFHNPPIRAMLDRVGYHPSRGYVFPGFRVHEGRLITEKALVRPRAGETLPGEGIEPPDMQIVPGAESFADIPTAACTWAIIAALCNNLLAEKHRREPRGIIIHARRGEAGWQAIHDIGLQLSLPTYQGLDGNESCFSSWRHGLPAIIDIRGERPERLLPFLLDPSAKNIVLITDSLVPWRQVGLGGWVLIDGHGAAGHLDCAPAISCLFRFLAETADSTMPRTIRRVLQELAKYCGRPKAPVFAAARQRLRGDQAYWTSPARRALAPVCYLHRLRSGQEIPSHKEGILLHLRRYAGWFAHAGFGQLSMQGIRRALHKAGWVLRDYGSQQLVIAKQRWISTLRIWAALAGENPSRGLARHG